MKSMLSAVLVSVVVAVGMVACGGEEKCRPDTCPPAAALVRLEITNHSGSDSMWVHYSITVRSPEGEVRAEASRWGMMELDGTFTGILSSPAVPQVGDTVTVVIAAGEASTTDTFIVQDDVTCTVTLVLRAGTPEPDMVCGTT